MMTAKVPGQVTGQHKSGTWIPRFELQIRQYFQI
jgi:hypothetical protein